MHYEGFRGDRPVIMTSAYSGAGNYQLDEGHHRAIAAMELEHLLPVSYHDSALSAAEEHSRQANEDADEQYERMHGK